MPDPVLTPHDVAATINQMHTATWAGATGIRIVSASRDEVVAELEVRPNHLQPHGIIHGGVHATVIETLASIGAAIDATRHGKTVVGLENHTTFLHAARSGTLRATALPLTRGRRSQVWETTIRDAEGKIVATGRVRLLVLEPEVQVGGTPLGSKI
jgi:uncharacterized protein (TIGR00369 family)